MPHKRRDLPVGGQRPAAGMVPAGERPEDRGGVPVMVEERTHREAAAVQVEQRPEHRSEVSAVIVERPEVDRAAVEADLDLPAGGGVPQRPVSAHAAHARQQQEVPVIDGVDEPTGSGGSESV